MRTLIHDFPAHILDAVRIGSAFPTTTPEREIRNVLITGLGGSGIGGKVVGQWAAPQCGVPIAVNNDYTLPGFVGPHTLVIVSSYSGNTEETVAAMKEAMSRGAQMAAVTSGGSVKATCEAQGIPHIVIPGGNPPRSMFAYSAVQLLFLLKGFGLVSNDIAAEMKGTGERLMAASATIESDALEIARGLENSLPVLYAEQNMEGVVVRWRQQINENSKMLCWHHVFPEMNHNELVGWETATDQMSVVVLKTSADHVRSRMRMDICEGIFKSKTPRLLEVEAKGEHLLEEIFYLVHFGDWVSLHLAELTGADPIDIRNIDFLKNELAKV